MDFSDTPSASASHDATPASTVPTILGDAQAPVDPVAQSKKRGRPKQDASVTKRPVGPASNEPTEPTQLRRSGRARTAPQTFDSIEPVGSARAKHPLNTSEAEASPRNAKRVHLDSSEPAVKSVKAVKGAKSAKGAKGSTKGVKGANKVTDTDPDTKEDAKAEKSYEKQIQKRGARIFKPVDVGDPARVVNRWAEGLGVPVWATSNLVPFPFDDASLFDKEAIAFMFVTPTDVRRQEPIGDKESMEIYFIPQRAAGPGHAVDSCFSLSLLNLVLNSPAILSACPEDLQALAREIFAADSATAAWRLFDLSSVGDKVHRVHEETHLLGDWSNEMAEPQFDKRSFLVRMREHKQKEAEHEVQTEPPKKGRKSKTSQPEAAAEEPANSEEQPLEHHITILLPINGTLWEIDSLMPEPRKIALIGEGMEWQLEVARYLNSLKDIISDAPRGPVSTYAATIYRRREDLTST
ncbi:hypothetical protein BGX31_008051 [Mortierella sp. GBA43]|nr:hypothetical protein BGX31_008051 [Mortierella sp. GBA43]